LLWWRVGAVAWLLESFRHQGLPLPTCDLVEFRRTVIAKLHKIAVLIADLDANALW
jgi:hypothetical protein